MPCGIGGRFSEASQNHPAFFLRLSRAVLIVMPSRAMGERIRACLLQRVTTTCNPAGSLCSIVKVLGDSRRPRWITIHLYYTCCQAFCNSFLQNAPEILACKIITELLQLNKITEPQSLRAVRQIRISPVARFVNILSHPNAPKRFWGILARFRGMPLHRGFLKNGGNSGF